MNKFNLKHITDIYEYNFYPVAIRLEHYNIVGEIFIDGSDVYILNNEVWNDRDLDAGFCYRHLNGHCLEELRGYEYAYLIYGNGRKVDWLKNVSFMYVRDDSNMRLFEYNPYINGYTFDWSKCSVEEDVVKSNKKEGGHMLSILLKKMLNKDVRTMVKAGYLDERLEITSKGEGVLTTIAFEKFKKEMVVAAEKEIEEMEEA